MLANGELFLLSRLSCKIFGLSIHLALFVVFGRLMSSGQCGVTRKVLLSTKDMCRTACEEFLAVDLREAEDVCFVCEGAVLALNGIPRRRIGRRINACGVTHKHGDGVGKLLA